MDPKAMRPVLEQVVKHIQFPATKAACVEACSRAGVPDEAQKWFAETLPNRTYNSAQEIFTALGA